MKGKKGGKNVNKVSDDLYDEEVDDFEEDEYFSKSEQYDSDGEEKIRKVTMFCKHTRYEIIKIAGKLFLEYHLTRKEHNDWDIAWFDAPITEKFLKRMSPWQRVNHYPGMYNLTRKNMLGRHLMRMNNYLPFDYNFFPTTYCLPHDYKDLEEELKNN